MRLTFIVAIRFPTEKAHGVAVAKMAEALAKQGVSLTLVVPRRRQPSEFSADRWEHYYGIKHRFKVVRLWCVDLLLTNRFTPEWAHPIAYFLLIISFQISLFFYLIRSNATLIFTRDMVLVPFLSLFGKKIYFEAHNWPDKPLVVWGYQVLTKKLAGVICISQPLIKEFRRLGVSSEKLLLAPSGVGQEFFKGYSKILIRKQLGLPTHAKIVTYTGSLRDGKGISTLIRASMLFRKRKDILFVIVGGNLIEKKERALVATLSGKPNVSYRGFQPFSQIPLFLAASDVLVLPNSGKGRNAIFRKYTSPLKLYEYLASGKPVVASKIPAFSGVVKDNEQVVFFKPDNAKDLVDKINLLFKNKHLARHLEIQGRELATQFTWAKRAAKIVKFMNSQINH